MLIVAVSTAARRYRFGGRRSSADPRSTPGCYESVTSLTGRGAVGPVGACRRFSHCCIAKLGYDKSMFALRRNAEQSDENCCSQVKSGAKLLNGSELNK